ncbi:cytochrome P450 [Micromonospora echinofusca]|uniref:Cytochrome P450 n=1 Tax=Micromonospora echinofusca TaxID=47858 RepID=A0ABS3VTW1_MICEH|nr:cytochrome P450 [Micromonospora echinofusca]
MRARHPLHRQVLPDGRSFLSVTRYRDACRVLGDHREFTSERGSLLQQLGHGDAAAGLMLVSTDPPRHTELRTPLNRVLSARAVRDLEPQVVRAVHRVLHPVLDRTEWDLAEQVAQLPMAVAGMLMGIPEQDWDQLTRWTAMAAAPEDPGLSVRHPAATLAIAHHGLFDYFAGQLRDDRCPRRDDLIGYLTSMLAGGRRLSTEEVIYNCYSLLLGANATTPHAAAGTVLALIEHPAQYAAAPGALPGLVEEGLRWTSPANSFLRHARHDVELSGGLVRRGEAVAVWVGSANRDAEVFPDPYRFDVARPDNRHIAFGFGPHYCLGAPLARMTLAVFFAELFRAFDRIEPDGPVTHLASNFIAGITHLPVRARPRTVSARERDG